MRRIVYCISLLVLVACGTGTVQNKYDFSDGTQLSEWNHTLTRTIVQDLFSPPLASRIYAYPNLAAYEILKFADDSLRSITARLKEFDPIPAPADKNIHLTIAALKAFTDVSKKLVYTEQYLDTLYKSSLDSFATSGINRDIIQRSEKYGHEVAEIILKRAAADHFKQTRGMQRYVLLTKPGSWEPTPPDYMPGAEPNWKRIHPLTLDSCSVFCPDSVMPFDTVSKTTFHAAALEVKAVSAALDSEKVSIIKFWDDNPNVSSHFGHATFFLQKMTPGGHWMAITSDVVRKQELSQPRAAMTYTLTSVAMFDAFITCWDAKYNFSTIRPVTYIQRYIDQDWEPYLQTPPFPEFPSGHSTVSAAAATVLTGLFGNNYAFTDSSEVPYGLPIRSFNSFMNAADEAAMSRLYGGIHFRLGNEAGQVLGKKVGNHVLTILNEDTVKKASTPIP